MDKIYYEQTFRKKYTEVEISKVNPLVQKLIEKNGSLEGLEYCTHYSSEDCDFYVTFSTSKNEEFYIEEDRGVVKANKFCGTVYVKLDKKAAIIAIRFLNKTSDVKSSIREFKEIIAKLNRASVHEAIEKVEEKWKDLTEESKKK